MTKDTIDYFILLLQFNDYKYNNYSPAIFEYDKNTELIIGSYNIGKFSNKKAISLCVLDNSKDVDLVIYNYITELENPVIEAFNRYMRSI
jgi:hypothetical protein